MKIDCEKGLHGIFPHKSDKIARCHYCGAWIKPTKEDIERAKEHVENDKNWVND